MIQFCNQAFCTMLGYQRDEIIHENIVQFLQNDDLFESCMHQLREHKKCEDQQTYFQHKDGHLITTVKSVNMIHLQGEDCLFVNIRNITDLDRANQKLNTFQIEVERQNQQLNKKIDLTSKALESSQNRLNEILSAISEIIWYIDAKSYQIIYVSDAIEQIFKVEKERFIQSPTLWQSMIHQEDQKEVAELFMHLNRGETQSLEFRIVRDDGSIRWLNNRITYHSDGDIFIGVTFDITENKTTQDQIEFLAYHDILTKLPNRAYLKKELELMIEQSKVITKSVALLFLDLDNFKYINDLHGHEVGDEVLIHVAQRLNRVSVGKAICCRFGGDEFIILIDHIGHISEVDTIATNIINIFKEPFLIANNEFYLSSSLGISLYPENAIDSSDLIKHADTAMYQAKRNGKNQYIFYNEVMDKSAQEFIYIEGLIREALSHDYLKLYFQPLVNATTHKVEGFEALLRFFHPIEGHISPEVFIPVAESTGDILTISAFVMQEACRFAKEINALSDESFFVNINISAKQFQQEQFATDFINCLLDNGVDPSLMKIELTESAVMNNIDIATLELQSLKEAGIKTALDDFGTGYSSFAYLAQLPIDVLKIDKSFVINLFEVDQNRHIIEAVSTMAKAMSMSVVAEGVETMEHAHYLNEKGVDILQGFLISKALSKEEIIAMLKTKSGFFSNK